MRAVQTAGGRAMHVNAKRLASASMRAIAEEHANGRTRTGGSEGKRVHDMPQLCRTSVFTKSSLSSRTSLFSVWREYAARFDVTENLEKFWVFGIKLNPSQTAIARDSEG